MGYLGPKWAQLRLFTHIFAIFWAKEGTTGPTRRLSNGTFRSHSKAFSRALWAPWPIVSKAFGLACYRPTGPFTSKHRALGPQGLRARGVVTSEEIPIT